MNRQQLLQETAAIIAKIVKHSDFTLTEESTAQDIKGWDSLSHMAIIVELEKRFQITFSFLEVVNLTNIGSMLNLLQEKL